ncbi:MAG: iron-containing alcohol dehydrogenase [Bacteroidales bacterium]|jgi:NADP-dependent alcohol dehydrogenase|nr:iron-containing alcohol dehydrogenase [Bacteroidales bacterium]
MNNFNYSNPVKIIFGKRTIAHIADEIPLQSKILLVYGGGSIKSNGVYQQVTEALKRHTLFEFSGIEANPTLETSLKAIELIKKESINFILAVGGGSVIDASKFMALGSQASGDPWEILSKGKYPEKALPLGTILTLPATGTEMNDRAVITNKALQDKRSFRTPLVFPRFSVLDPEVTYSLPVRQVANGVVDTFVHTTEQYLTYPDNAQVQDRFAESILKILVDLGPQALKTPEDYHVRGNLMWASSWALNGWIGQGVPEDWATHQIGHELTAFYGLDHAQTLAIVLPGVLESQFEYKMDKLAQFGERVFNLNQPNTKERAKATIDAIEAFFKQMGVGTRLSDYGLGDEVPAKVANRLRERGWVLGEHQRITADVVETLLQSRR